MSTDAQRRHDIFMQVHSNLPREGPGNRECTQRALALAGPLPTGARVLDIACGPGMQTLHLAELLPQAHITAVDAHPAYVEEARRRVAAADCSQRVTLQVADMRNLPFADAAFDLIWCEGAAYIMGVEAALASWRRLLAPGGRVALSEAVWLTNNPPERVRACWEEYPALTDVPGCRQRVRAAGYDLLGDFLLPEAAWWSYYDPMQQRVEMLQRRFADDPESLAELSTHTEEIAVYRAHADCYTYIFLVAEKTHVVATTGATQG